MSDTGFNKYRAAIEVLQRGRDVLVEGLADDILDKGEDLAEGGFLFNEFLEAQGTRIHFLTLLIGLLEQSADVFDDARPAPPPPPPKAPAKRRSRSKKIQQQASQEKSADDL
ncbi:MAG: hypothetical protein ACM35G_08225 [Planctomycetaceae bacterium]